LDAPLRDVQVACRRRQTRVAEQTLHDGDLDAGLEQVIFMNWSASQAIEELRSGGFGYHASYYPNITKTLTAIDVLAIRKCVLDRLPN
jgi:hypothetical protein